MDRKWWTLLASCTAKRWRLVPARANAQLAFGGYTWDEQTRTFIPHEVNVRTLRGAEIEEIIAFLTPDAFARFGLPASDPSLRPRSRQQDSVFERRPSMTNHKIVNREEWADARKQLLVREKEHTRRGDDLARQRRELPWVPVDKEYRFETDEGTRTLAELFDGRSQLIVYHFMFGPDYTAGCATCSATADSFNGVLPHLQARDVTMICISRAPLEKLLAYRRRMGWSFNWASSYESDFNFDFGVSAADEAGHEVVPLLEANEVAAHPLVGDQAFRDSLPRAVEQNAAATGLDVPGYFTEGHGVSTFARDGDSAYHCYSGYARGTEFLMGYYAILDRTPKGRDEGDEMWVRRHDEYDA